MTSQDPPIDSSQAFNRQNSMTSQVKSRLSRKTSDNTELEHLNPTHTHDRNDLTPKSRRRSKQKSASLDNSAIHINAGTVNPIYSGYNPESPMSVRLSGPVPGESSTDPQPHPSPREGISAAQHTFDHNSPGKSRNVIPDKLQDIPGSKCPNVYPYQRDIHPQVRNKTRERSQPSQYQHQIHIAKHHSEHNERTQPQLRHRPLKSCYSLDSARTEAQLVPHMDRRLYHINEGQAAKRRSPRSLSSSSTEDTDCSPRSSRSIGAKFTRTGSTNTLPGGLMPDHKTERTYSSAVNINMSNEEASNGVYEEPHLDLLTRNDILPSPPLSPRCPQLRLTLPGDSNGQIDVDDLLAPLIKQRSSESVHSADDDSDSEPSPTSLRRGRRQAIVDSKTLGVITAPDGGETSPTNSCDESESSNTGVHSEKKIGINGERKFNDDMVKVHRKKVLIKRNTVHDFAQNKSYQAILNEQENKKNKMSFVMKLIDKKGNKDKQLAELSDVLQVLKPTEFKDQALIQYKTLHWSELIKDRSPDTSVMSNEEKKRREAVWEVFQSECVFLIDHLMVLKHCFMEPLKKVQVEGHLMFAEPQDLFGNLDELCYVSYTFCKDFISLLLKDARVRDFGRTGILVKAMQRYSQLSRDGEVFHEYCLNYTKAVNYLEILRKNDKFCEFERWCENDGRCHRLQMTDLLISPMQHCTKLPLLLRNITRYTEDPEEKQQLVHSLEKLQTSLNNLEAKMKWLKNFERVQEIQQQIQWQAITDLDPRAYIPEFLKSTLSRQPCERLLASPKRQLLYEGPLSLIEISKVVDMYMFLFDDILLLTKIKKPPRKKSDVEKGTPSMRSHTEGAVFVVHKQPIALDRFTVHDIKAPDSSANGLKHAFVLVQISRFQQIIGVYTLQAHSEAAKASWLEELRNAQEKYKQTTVRRQSQIPHTNSVIVNCDERLDEETLDNCLSAVVAEKRNSEESDTINQDLIQSGHEPIIRTPSATKLNVTQNCDAEMTEELKKDPNVNNNIAGFSLTSNNALFYDGSKQAEKQNKPDFRAKHLLTKHNSLQHFTIAPHHIDGASLARKHKPRELNIKGIDDKSVDRVRNLVSPSQKVFPDNPVIEQKQLSSSTNEQVNQAFVPSNAMSQSPRPEEDNRPTKLSRLKAIHESSQSLDVIYI